MTPEELKQRTKEFGLKTIQLVDQLPQHKTADTIGRQLVRAAMSVGANYRAACRARSQADFVSKIGVVEEEADELSYWLEVLQEARIASGDGLGRLLKEARELTAIFVASKKTAKQNPRRRPLSRQSSIANQQ